MDRVNIPLSMGKKGDFSFNMYHTQDGKPSECPSFFCLTGLKASRLIFKTPLGERRLLKFQFLPPHRFAHNRIAEKGRGVKSHFPPPPLSQMACQGVGRSAATKKG